MSKNIVDSEGRQMAKRWSVVYWISKGTRAQAQIFKTSCFSTATMVTRTPLSVTQYVYCLSFYIQGTVFKEFLL